VEGVLYLLCVGEVLRAFYEGKERRLSVGFVVEQQPIIEFVALGLLEFDAAQKLLTGIGLLQVVEAVELRKVDFWSAIVFDQRHAFADHFLQLGALLLLLNLVVVAVAHHRLHKPQHD